MKTLLKIAWRNCVRNGLRTTIVISAISLGVWSSIFLMGFTSGFVLQRIDKMVALQIGDIQIHSPSFDYNSDISNTIKNEKQVIETIQNSTSIAVFSERFRTEAYAVTAHGQSGVKLLGVYPEKEKQVLGLSERMVEGTFLKSNLSYPIIVGAKLAKDLHLKLNSKIQLNFTNIAANQISKNFKVCGIFKAGDDAFDGYTVFTPMHTIEKLTNERLIHEIIIKVDETNTPENVALQLNAEIKDNLVEDWKTRFPEVAYGLAMMDSTMFVLMSIIVFALLFGIINTLMMSILERKREIGVLLAIGMSKPNIRGMIVLESIIYGLIGAPIGIFLGYLTMQYYGNYGLDLSAFGEGMEAFGYDPIIYLSVEAKYYLIYAVYIIVATIVGGLYPSRIATKLNPIEAIRSI